MITDTINNLTSPWNIVAWAGCAIIVLFFAWLLIKLNKIVFKRLGIKHKGVNFIFLQHLCSIIIIVTIIILVVSSFSGVQSIWQTLLGGTAIISAVMAFVAQDIIKDILAGIMLSFHRPFTVGDRIMLEDGSSGIVEEMTMRHIVICPIDTVRQIIPNSKVNAAKITNYSYQRNNRSAEFNFSIGYDSNIALAKEVIGKAIKDSKYSLPGISDKDGNDKYANVYFMRFADSALIIHATVYYDNSTPSAVLIDDINMRVREALVANNIEIPYNYVNVVSVDSDKKTKQKKTAIVKAKTKAVPKANAEIKSKVAPKSKVTPKAKAEHKVNAAPKAKAVPKVQKKETDKKHKK